MTDPTTSSTTATATEADTQPRWAALADGYTEAELRAAYEAVKTQNEAARYAQWAANFEPLTCPRCKARAIYLARPESVRYYVNPLQWDDEQMTMNVAASDDRIACQYDHAAPGYSEINDAVDSFAAFAWCGQAECEWFDLGADYALDHTLRRAATAR